MEIPFEEILQKLDALMEGQATIRKLVINGERIERPLSTKEACQHLGIGKTTLNSFIQSGLVPSHTIQGYSGRKFFKSELNDWVRSGGLMKVKKVG